MLLVNIKSSFAQTENRNTSSWVFYNSDKELKYKTTEKGDRILDFSFAGYKGGGVALPTAPIVKEISSEGENDASDKIQRAIDEISVLPLRNALRGTIVLDSGVFNCSKTISIHSSGIILTGKGSGSNGTVINMTGDKHCAFIIGSNESDDDVANRSQNNSDEIKYSVTTTIMDSYVPSGSTAFSVENINGFEVGDTIFIKRPVTNNWLHFIEMDNLKRDGREQTFLSTKRTGDAKRVIKKIEGNKINIDIPLPDSYDSAYLNPPGAIVVKEKKQSTISNVGIEKIRIKCPPLEIKYSEAPYSAVQINGDDCWIKDIYCDETMNSTSLSGNRITVQNVEVYHTYPNLGASKPADFNIKGSQILIDRCKATGGNTYFVWTSSLVCGPNVVLNSSFSGNGSRLQPHQRWSTGLLIDNCKILDGGIDYMNRGVAGSGHGWTMAWGVVWNSIAKTFIIQNPPGTLNWAIGCIGTKNQTARLFDSKPIIPDGEYESFGKNVFPQSLYLAQLKERLGRKALLNVGYDENEIEKMRDDAIASSTKLKYEKDPKDGIDLARNRPVNTSNVRGNKREYGAEKALDGNEITYWMTDDGVETSTFEVDTEGPIEINSAEICEAASFEGRIQEYKIEGQIQSDWKLLSKGFTVGKSKIDEFPKETVWKVRLTIVKSKSPIAIKKFGLYLK